MVEERYVVQEDGIEAIYDQTASVNVEKELAECRRENK